MSEENRWDEDLPEVNENVPTEEKPLEIQIPAVLQITVLKI